MERVAYSTEEYPVGQRQYASRQLRLNGGSIIKEAKGTNEKKCGFGEDGPLTGKMPESIQGSLATVAEITARTPATTLLASVVAKQRIFGCFVSGLEHRPTLASSVVT